MPVHLPRVPHRSGRSKFYMMNIIFNCMLVVKSSQNFSQVSVPSESEIFAFRSFCPISATTQYAPQTPYEIPPIVVKRLFKFRLKFEFVLKFVPHQMAIVVNDGIVKTTYALSFSSLKNKQTKNPKIINASP